MPANYQIQPMVIEDYDKVLELWRSAGGVGLNESDTRANIAAYLTRNPGMSFVARHGGKLVGAVLCGHDGRRGYLHHLAVAKAHRRLGLGRRLVQNCFDQLAAARILKCTIFLFADNDDGRSFWTRTGWAMRDDLQMLQKVLRQSPAV